MKPLEVHNSWQTWVYYYQPKLNNDLLNVPKCRVGIFIFVATKVWYKSLGTAAKILETLDIHQGPSSFTRSHARWFPVRTLSISMNIKSPAHFLYRLMAKTARNSRAMDRATIQIDCNKWANIRSSIVSSKLPPQSLGWTQRSDTPISSIHWGQSCITYFEHKMENLFVTHWTTSAVSESLYDVLGR